MRIRVCESELWPVYYFRSANLDNVYDQKCSIEVDESTLNRWREARAAFDKAQAEIGNLLGKAGLLDKL